MGKHKDSVDVSFRRLAFYARTLNDEFSRPYVYTKILVTVCKIHAAIQSLSSSWEALQYFPVTSI